MLQTTNTKASVTGGSRGIGRAVCIALARCGANVVVAAKTATEDPKLPGTIHTVTREIRDAGGSAMAYQLDVQDDRQVEACVEETVKTFGGVHIVVNNASALWWKNIDETPMNRFDLMFRVNARGSFSLARAAFPHMKKAGWGHVINMSPPIKDTHFSGRTAYSITKTGMTIVALGIAEEGHEFGVAGHALWPSTLIESSAVENFQMGSREMWRKADIMSDAVLTILAQDPKTFTGKAWIDEDLLRQVGGVTDFAKYRCDPNVEPATMAELAGADPLAFNRGKALGVEERKKEEARFKKAAKL